MWVASNVIKGIHQQNQMISLLIDLIQQAAKDLCTLLLFILNQQIDLFGAMLDDLLVYLLKEVIGSLARREFAQIKPDKNMMAQILFKKLLHDWGVHTA